MAASQAYRLLWIIVATFAISPHLNLGMLSDYKICGDSECERMMSRVQAVRDHHSKDCRFLSFRRGDTIFVYHKLTGKREDLWAGTIDRQFGYFPKDAVQEEQVYATMEKVVVTQESDFFCMDEFGYPIDSTHLDTDDGDSDQKIQIQESETTQTPPHTDDTNAETPLTSADPATEPPVSAQEADGDENKNVGDAAAGPHDEAHETPATLNEQGGSPSSSWLGSSVTGWLGLAKDEQPGSLAEEEKEDDRKETQAETSLTSSVTGWLGFGGEGKPDDTEEGVKIREETADSLTSTMTGWLGFGREETIDPEKNELDEEKEEPVETFRSRRMSLDLEGSQLHEEEKEDMGTLGWLGNGLSSTLGFGRTDPETGHETTSGGKAEEESEQPASSSWLDIGMGGMLGFRKDDIGADESTGSGFKETEEDINLQQPAGSQNVDTSKSQPALIDEVKVETSNESQVEELPKDQHMPSIVADNDDSNEDRSTEQVEGENQQMPKSIGNEVRDNNREPGEEQIKTPSGIDQDFITLSNSNLGPDHSSVDLKSNSMGDSVGKVEEDEKDQLQGKKIENVQEEEAQITNEADNTEESINMSTNTGASDEDHKGEGSNEDAELPHKDVFTTQTEKSAEGNQISSDAEDRELSQRFLSSAEERHEPSQVEDDSFTPHTAETDDDNSDTPAMADNNAETETRHGELGQEEDTQTVEGNFQEFGSLHSSSRSQDNLYGNASEEDGETIISNADQASVSPQMENSITQSDSDAESLKGTLKDSVNNLQKVQTERETSGFEENVLNESDLKSTTSSEMKTGEVEESKDGGKQEMIEVKENEKLEDIKEGIEEEEKQPEVNEVKEEVEEEQEELKDVEDLNKEGQQEKVEDKKEKEEGKEFKEEEKTENSKNEEKQGNVESLRGEKKNEEAVELKGEEEGEEAMEMKKERKQGEIEEPKEEEKQQKTEKLLEEEKQTWVEEVKEEKKKLEESNEDTSRPESESNDKETQDVNGSSFPETPTKTESSQVEEEKGEDEENKQEVVEEIKGEKMDGEEVEEKQQLNHVEDDSIDCSNELCPSEDEPVIERDGGSSEDGVSSVGKAETTHALYTEEGLDVRGDGDSDVQMRKNDSNAISSASWSEGGWEHLAPPNDPVERQAVTSEQTGPHESEDPTGSSLPPDDHNRKTSESDAGGAFGLFKNAFGFFSQTPTTETEGPTEPELSSNANSDETSQPQASLAPEQELDSTTESNQNQDVHPDCPIAISTEQPEPYPPSAEIHLHTASPNTEVPLQAKTLSKHYKNLLTHMTVDEATVLLELFGRHKMQFLDYILASSDAVTENPDDDVSILLDIERLLHHHRERLVAPSMRLADEPQEDKEKTRMLISLQKLEMLLEKVRNTFNTGKADASNHQAEASCVGASCSTQSKDEKESRKVQDSYVAQDNNIQRDKWMTVEKDNSQVGGGRGTERKYVDDQRDVKMKGSDKESFPQPGSPQPLEGVMKQILDFVHQMAEDARAAREFVIWLTVEVVSSLPDDIRPGPDLYGVPWEPVIISSLVGLVTVLLFTCRCYSSIKSRMYRSKEQWMAEQVAQLLDEKCEVLKTLSQCQQEHDDLESSLRDSGVLAQTQKSEHLEIKARQLDHAKRELGRDLEQLKDQVDEQREHRIEQERRIAMLEDSMKTFEEETKDLQSQEEQAQTTLKVYSMNSDRLQRNLETAREENTVLQESNAQLRQQVEGWAERVSEVEAEMRRYEVTHSGMQQDVANKDERIMSLTDRLLRMKAWDSNLGEEVGEEGGEKETTNGTPEKGEANGRGNITGTHLQKVQKLIYAAKLNADLKSVDEDKDRAFAKLNDEVKAKEDLQVGIKELEKEKLSLQSDTEHYSEQVQRLQQKLQIMTEMYQENELKLHRMLTVEEKERLQKEEKLNKADKNITMAMEELSNYRQRAEDMEEELEKTKQSYQTQISAHEKKAHNNWLAARAADRELSDIRRENGLLRQKLTDTQFKLDTLDKDPYALDSLARPLPFRAERSPYGPSPLGRPASETRAFLSSPTLMDGPPTRLSPRVARGPGEPPGGQGEMERSGGPHSDSGSISPTWERDRRGPPPGPPGPLGHPGYMFPDGPMYRRPPPPGSLPPGPLPPRVLPPGPPHPLDMADGSYRENSLGPGEQERRESGPGERRTPPEGDPRMGGPPPPGHPMGPMDGPFPRRAPYGAPPPPDFYPPRGPGGPPMMPMWAPPPPGMMFHPRFPHGGPPLPPGAHPHMPSYGPPMRPPPPEGLPPSSMGRPHPQQSLPSPPHSQSPEENTPSPEDAI